MTRPALHRILPSDRDWPLFDVLESRRLEVAALATAAPHALMQAAGRAIAQLALAVAPHAGRVWIAAGPGNNGGDGLEAAVHLAAAGRQVEVDLLGRVDALPADARRSFERAAAAGAVVRSLSDPLPALGPDDLAVDALLGLGARRAPADALADAIRALNAQRCAVIAVDLPSGLAADTGQPFGEDCVVATHTVSLLCLRPGLFTGVGRDHAGEVWLADLGIDAATALPTARLSASRPPPGVPRRHAQNKGSFGDAIVVGGATGMTGAALLAGRAAQAAGAGRVYIHLLQPPATALAVDILRPELMFRGDALLEDAQLGRSTVVCGCGGGDAAAAVLPRLLASAARLVLDADALNAVAKDAGLAAGLLARSAAGRPTVLTPHPLEAARLLGRSTGEVQADRLSSAAALVARFGCCVVLKGSGSVVAAPGRVPQVNASGNASLASAGTGDVLAGWLGGLWAQAGDPGDGFETAVRAVAQHGAGATGHGAVRAGDLVETLRGSA